MVNENSKSMDESGFTNALASLHCRVECGGVVRSDPGVELVGVLREPRQKGTNGHTWKETSAQVVTTTKGSTSESNNQRAVGVSDKLL